RPRRIGTCLTGAEEGEAEVGRRFARWCSQPAWSEHSEASRAAQACHSFQAYEVSQAELVKRRETTSHADLMSASGVGSLIQATVGSFGGCGRRCRNRAGLAA